MTDFSTMTDAEVNRRVAEAMGFLVDPPEDQIPDGKWYHTVRPPSPVLFEMEGNDFYDDDVKTFSPATSIEDAWGLLERIVEKDNAHVRVWGGRRGWGVDVEGPDWTYEEITIEALTTLRAISEAFLAWHEAQKEEELK